MTNEFEPTVTLDMAQQIVIAALEGRLTENRIAYGWATIEDVEDGGAGRCERLVGFDLVMPDGARKTFVATIEELEKEDA